MVDTTAPDQAARRRIVDDLDHTLFVSAGAGSGKTSSLVERVVALVVDGGIDIEAIAAITFTEKAAAELADRVRAAFERLADDPGGEDPAAAARATEALQGLDRAAIGTLHSFAQRVLREHPLEVELPPRVEVLDEIESEVAFEARWQVFARGLFERALDDPGLEQAVLVALTAGVKLSHLRALAVVLGDNWDRVAARGDLVGMAPVEAQLDAAGVDRLLDDLAAAVEPAASGPEGDLLRDRLLEFDRLHDRLRAVTDDLARCEALMTKPKVSAKKLGKAANWGGADACAAIRDALHAVEVRLEAWKGSLVATAVDRLIGELGRFTIDSADARRREGRLEFHDLLVLARRLLTQGRRAGEVRRRLHERYHRLLLDEFQDTDPIQVEIAVGIAADPDQPWPATGDWRELPVPPGRLFFVGDPKQSIYRFRRADIALYLHAQERFADGRVTLSANFRTVEPVLDWVNRVFGDLVEARDGSQPAFEPLVATRPPVPDAGPSVTVLGAEVHEGSLPADELRRLEARDVAAVVRTALDDGWLVDDEGERRAVVASDITVLLPTRTSLEQLEVALDGAGVAFRAEASSLVYGTREVRDLLATARAVDDPTDALSVVTALRSAAFGCSDRDLFDHRVVRDGPWDHQARRLDPGWVPPDGADPDDPRQQSLPADHPVVDGLRYLRRLHRDRVWSTPSELLDRLVRERRLLELGVSRRRARDVWRRLRFVVDQARAWSEAGGGDLRDYLAWVGRQAAEDRVTEAVLPETDDEAVRIMTVHAAKGLEFPVVVLSGSTTAAPSPRETVRVAWTPDRLGYRIPAAGFQTSDFEGLTAADAALDHDERIRLLYVACTRARDHLVVSAHRAERGAGSRDANGVLLGRALAEADHWTFPPAVDHGSTSTDAPLDGATDDGPPEPDRPDGADDAEVARWLAEVERWRAQRRRAVAGATALRTWSATALAKAWVERDRADDDADLRRLAAETEAAEPADPAAVDDAPVPTTSGADADGHDGAAADDPGLEKEPRDLELPPWNKGRYGTAVGRAVHAVLQAVDLAAAVGASVEDPPEAVLDGDALAAFRGAVATQAAGEGVAHLEDLVARLAWAGLTSDRVARAVAAPRRWRELYVGAPIERSPVEGYIDLLYRTDQGHVVVDYKTDTTSTDADRATLLERYRGQGATYALAVEQVTGQPVLACVFLLLAPSGATEVVLDGDELRATAEDVRQILDATGGPLSR